MNPYWQYRKYIEFQEWYIESFKNYMKKYTQKHEWLLGLAISTAILSIISYLMAFELSPILLLNIFSIVLLIMVTRRFLHTKRKVDVYIQEMKTLLAEMKELPDCSISFEEVLEKYMKAFEMIHDQYFQKKNKTPVIVIGCFLFFLIYLIIYFFIGYH